MSSKPIRPSLITLFCDASFCPNTSVGSFAVWAKANNKTLRRSGIFKQNPVGSDVAEIWALANGVALVIKIMNPVEGARIIAQSDSLSAIAALRGTGYRTKEGRLRVGKAVNIVNKLIAEHKLQIEYRHVKVHKGYVDPRSSVNEWCHIECLKLLREARLAITVENQSSLAIVRVIGDE